jgi:hypothetical protein
VPRDRAAPTLGRATGALFSCTHGSHAQARLGLASPRLLFKGMFAVAGQDGAPLVFGSWSTQQSGFAYSALLAAKGARLAGPTSARTQLAEVPPSRSCPSSRDTDSSMPPEGHVPKRPTRLARRYLKLLADEGYRPRCENDPGLDA